ncbi:MAG: hypothetical protein LBS87_00710 [Puniceicoccales bacterium]|jgi:hypothetical protein|nr:hypothetical protein [Puniceicoccales bacterium]
MVEVNNKMDESISENGLYGRVCCFFQKHSKRIYIGLGATFLLILAIICGRVYLDFRLARMRRDYANLTDNASKVLFVKKYGKTSLGGLVFLDLGNDAFSRKDYKFSSSYYQSAEKALGETEFALRAKILRAISLFNSGNRERGLTVLNEVVHDKLVDGNLRAEAAYRYVCCAAGSGEVDKVNKIVQYSKGLNIPVRWQGRIETEL